VPAPVRSASLRRVRERPPTSDLLVGGGALALLAAAFLPWFHYALEDVRAHATGWDVGFVWAGVPAALAAVLLATAVVRAVSPSTELPPLPLPWPQVRLAAAGVAAVLVLLKLLVGEDAPPGVEVDRGGGILLALLASLVMVGGALAGYSEADGDAEGA
jgi:hypothetical protein